MTTTQLKPMGIGDILDAAFNLYKNRFATFVTIAAVVYVPYSIVSAATAAWMRSIGFIPVEDGETVSAAAGELRLPSDTLAVAAREVASAQPEPAFGDLPMMTYMMAFGAAAVGIMLFMLIVYPLCSGALLVNISAGYLGEELGAAESYRRVFRRFGTLIVAQFVATVCIFAGFLFCLVPGVIFSLWFLVVPSVVLLEDQPALSSLGRSKALMANNLGKGFLLTLVVTLLTFAISLGSGTIVGLVPWPVPFIGDFLQSLIGGLVLPLSVGVFVLLYYDLRIRKEAFDLQHLAAKMGALRAR